MANVDEGHGPVHSAQREPAPNVVGKRWVRASTPDDGPAIVALMRSVGLEPHADPEHLHWKYWQERGDWSGSRSFVLTDGRDLLAHVAVVPGALWCGVNRKRVIHMIDWAARRDVAGAGIRLARHVTRLSDLVIATGGSPDTLKLLPMMGYSQCGSISGYVRTLSPLGILRGPIPSRSKLVPRMARSLLWSLAAPKADTAGWGVRRIGPDEIEQTCPRLPTQIPGTAIFERSPALLRHALSCPIIPVEIYVLEKAGRAGGYFVLSQAPGQARIADMRVASEEDADWHALIYAAVNEARSKGRLAELIVWSSDPRLSRALEDCGFHARLSLPLYLHGGAHRATPRDTMRIQMLDCDAYYLYFGGNELWA